MNSKIEQVKELITQLSAMLAGHSIQLEFRNCTHPELTIHGATYAQATDFMRSFGIGDRKKTITETVKYLSAIQDGIEFTAFFDDMPPTCHKEKYIERIPKTQTVETGEFIEVERDRIVCTGAEGGAK